MQLNELLEKYSIEEISHNTKISIENLQSLFDKTFENLKRIKAMGFISILEREYGLESSALREEAEAYYNEHPEKESIVIDPPLPDLKEENHYPIKLVVLIVIGILVWYISEHFDNQAIRNLFYSEKSSLIQVHQEDTAGLGIGNETENHLINQENN